MQRALASYLRCRAVFPALRRQPIYLARISHQPTRQLQAAGRLRAAAAAAAAGQLSGHGMSQVAAPPEGAGAPIMELDREQFRQQLNVRALRVPTKQLSQYLRLLSRHLLNKPRLKNTQDIEDPTHKLLLLGENVGAKDLGKVEVERGGQALTLQQLMELDGLQLEEAQVEVDYSYFPVTQILQRILPPGSEVPSAFEQVGHIAHLNLREELLPWKYVIGQVILDKNPRLRTVVNKVGAIENEWRVFQMEVLATTEGAQQGQQGRQQLGGAPPEGAMVTEVRQHGARFKLDFSKVYWNSRLEGEHHRLVGLFNEGETVLDVMAGIGPFAVPAAQKGCMVWANDLNPDSFRWLRANVSLNKVTGRVVPFNLDGREVIRLAARGALPLAAAAEDAAVAAAAEVAAAKKGRGQQGQQQQQETGGEKGDAGNPGVAAAAAGGKGAEKAAKQVQQQQQAAAKRPQVKEAPPPIPETGGIFHHAVMNLPATAIEFVDAFRGSFDPQLWEGHPLPLVHVYCFCKSEEGEADMQRRVETALGGPLDGTPAFHLVRNVAPNKNMYCISFRVPSSLAFAGEAGQEEGAGGKRQKVA